MHGTTRLRAERILQQGPDPCFQEPVGIDLDDGFSMNLEAGPFLDEGGPVILAVDVPDEVVMKSVNDGFPLSQGLVEFDHGSGLEELLLTWPNLVKEIRRVP